MSIAFFRFIRTYLKIGCRFRFVIPVSEARLPSLPAGRQGRNPSENKERFRTSRNDRPEAYE
jgi:hypothetical protein